ncbi:MAG TPA: GAF domain-containing protein, partial [Candidatus Saccharimonadales bacterium]|nr:GAF domain-containing protein [Candidatus Saccharimonadales bacterium]
MLAAWQAREGAAACGGPAARAGAWELLCDLAGRYEAPAAGREAGALDAAVDAPSARRLQCALHHAWPALASVLEAGGADPALGLRAAGFFAALAPALLRARWRHVRARLRARAETRLRETREAIRIFRELFDFSREVACALDLESARRSIVRWAIRVLRSEWVCLYEPDGDGRTLRMVASSRGREFTERAPRIELGTASLAARAFHSLTCTVLQASGPLAEAGAAPEFGGLISALFAPLVGLDGPKGVLVLGSNTQPHVCTQLEIDTALSFAGHAALAVENARLFSEARATNERWAALLDVCRVVTSSLDRDTILRRIVDHATALSRARDCTMFLLEPERQELYP